MSLALVGATLVSYLAGFALGSRWLLPVLNTAPAYAMLVALLRRGERRRATRLMLLWAASLIVLGTLASVLFPERAERVVLHGAAYRDLMVQWVETGEGEESHPSRFLPTHALHLAIYLPLSIGTAGAGGMLMGAVLTNYMNFFVASLALGSTSPGLVGLLGWFPWSLARVGGYVILGVLAAEPLVCRGRAKSPRAGALGAALALLLADVLLKGLIAPAWGRLLASFLIEK